MICFSVSKGKMLRKVCVWLIFASSGALNIFMRLKKSYPTLCDPIDGRPPGSRPWDSPGKNTGVGCHFLLQCVKVKSLSSVRLLATPWTVAYQAPLSMGFPRQEYWSGVPGILQRAGCPLLFVKLPETFWKGFLGGKPPGLVCGLLILGRRQARSWTPGLL